FIAYDKKSHIAIDLQKTTCTVLMAQALRFNATSQPYSLVLQTNPGKSFTYCLAVAETLRPYASNTTLSAQAEPRLLEHFHAFKNVSAIREGANQGQIYFKRNGKQGIISREGDILIEPRYDFIYNHPNGFVLSTNEGNSVANPNGRVILPGPFEDVNLYENMIV